MRDFPLFAESPSDDEPAVRRAHVAQCEAEGITPMPWDDLPGWVRESWRRVVRHERHVEG